MQLARIGMLLTGLLSLCSSPVLSQTTDYTIGDRDILSVTVWSQMDRPANTPWTLTAP